jgi:hypothetical protein
MKKEMKMKIFHKKGVTGQTRVCHMKIYSQINFLNSQNLMKNWIGDTHAMPRP